MDGEENKPEYSIPPARPARTTRGYAWGMRLIGLLHLGIAAVFFFFPGELIYLINVGPKVFKLTEAIPDPTDHFWIVLAASQALTLGALGFLAAESPRVRGYTLVMLLATVAAAAGFLYMFLNDRHLFAYIVGMAVYGLLSLLVAWNTVRAPRGTA